MTVERIVTDERTVGSERDPAPRWEIWLDRPDGAIWTPARFFVAMHDTAATIATAPSYLTVVARPMPAEYCEPGERPADPTTP